MSFFQAVTTVDFAVLDFIQEHLRCAFLDVLMPFFSYIAEGGAVWIIAAVVMLFFRKTRKWGLLVLVAMAAGFIIGEICLKNIICRVRPCYFTDIAMLVNKPNSYSFPSGHSCSSFAAATIIFFMNKKVGAAAIVLAFLVAFSRMYVYVHYPTDVLCGILLGVLCAVVTYSIYKKYIEKIEPKDLAEGGCKYEET